MRLIEQFNQIEKPFFDIKKNGIQLWPLVREQVILELSSEINNSSKANRSDKEQPFKGKFKALFFVCINTLKYFFISKKKVKFMILNHPRKRKINGKYVDIYTDPILDEFEEDYICLESLFQLQHLKPSYQKKILPADLFDFWTRLASLILYVFIIKKEDKVWVELECQIYNVFKHRIDIQKKVQIEYIRALVNKWLLKKLLYKLKPELILQVVGYNRLNKHVNIVAKELEIPTLELQHGFISKDHQAYNFPDNVSNVQTFPDYFAVWSDFFKSQINVPIPNENLVTSGFKFFHGKIENLKRTEQQHNILVISQGTIGLKLVDLVLALKKMSSYKIIYRLHPGEIPAATDLYPELYNNQDKFLSIDDSFESDLYVRIKNADVVIGVYSTALLESLSIGIPTIIVKLPGWEVFSNLNNVEGIPIFYSNPEVHSMLEIIMEQEMDTIEQNKLIIEKYDKYFINQVNQRSAAGKY